ncbi:MAG: DedA family protein [Bdellovibrionales bacterium]|nr:DedA family protein [Bdellovibrionales bacterium]
MDILDPLLQIATDPLAFFQFFGYMGLAAILFAEVGLFGFFLPGDSLLLTLGLISAKGDIDIKILIPTLLIATILGDHFSYFLGRKFSTWVKKNMGKILLEERHLDLAHDFYVKHGGKTILFCKFIAFVRTFAPFIAGTSKMSYIKFTIYEVAGAILWVVGIVGGAHYLGKIVDFDIRAYFHYFVILLIFLLISPFFLKFFKNKRK